MTIQLFDREDVRLALLPLTFTRPIALQRLGIDTIADKWQRAFPDAEVVATSCAPELAELFPAPASPTLQVAGHVLPDAPLVEAIKALGEGEAITDADGRMLAHRGEPQRLTRFNGELRAILRPTDIFHLNPEVIRDDFRALTAGRVSQSVGEASVVIGPKENLFIEPGATVIAAVINVTTGPVYIGANAEIAEGSTVRGPLALCSHSHINMGTKVYPGTTIGPWCKVGGELNNVVFQGYSNKAHDGFLGNAVIGSWCNLGADTVASNLKNDYSETRLWNYATGHFERTGSQFCGLIMGDHSKAGINTMFNTATSVGVGCNIYGAGFPRTFIPSFVMGGADGFEPVIFKKFVEAARRMMARRNVELSEADERLLASLYQASAK